MNNLGAGSIMVEEEDEVKIQEKRGDFEYENWYLKFKSLNLGIWLYTTGFLLWIRGIIHWPSPHI